MQWFVLDSNSTCRFGKVPWKVFQFTSLEIANLMVNGHSIDFLSYNIQNFKASILVIQTYWDLVLIQI